MSPLCLRAVHKGRARHWASIDQLSGAVCEAGHIQCVFVGPGTVVDAGDARGAQRRGLDLVYGRNVRERLRCAVVLGAKDRDYW
jgi:hypothetical protein